jgi:hypothetical protein
MNLQKKLIVLVADTEMRLCVRAVLERFPKTESIPRFEYEVIGHGQHDPGCYQTPEVVLRKFIRSHDFALVIFDYDGCGQRDLPTSLEEKVKRKLGQNGWNDRCECIVIEPELENWIWIDSQEVATALGWGKFADLKYHLVTKHLWNPAFPKPERPKEAAEEAIRAKRGNWSPRIHEAIGKNASFKSCTSPSFLKFKDTIVRWFSPENP